MRILLGMSGGLDSTYAAHKLISEGHIVEGAVIKMHKYTEIQEALQSAEALGVPLHVIDAEELFEKKVISDFIEEYRNARTPNPCIICNSEVKFRVLFDYATSHGFDRIATGHYASVVKIHDENGERFAVRLSEDSRKDQTYMLWRLSQDILSKLVFPLSEEKKCNVRDEARLQGFSAADRPESQEICFIKEGSYTDFIEERVGKSIPGYFIDRNGNKLGEHKGIIHYTVGQRKGLGIALGQRAFITDINVTDNTVTLDVGDSYRDCFTVSKMVFSGMRQPALGEKMNLMLKHRYLAPPCECTVTFFKEGCASVKLPSPIRAVTPGQSAVFYKDGVLMAGGFISLP